MTPSQCSTSFDLYSLRARLPHGTSSTRAWTTSTLRRRSRIASASAGSAAAPRASSTLTGSGGSCLTPGEPRPHADVAADRGREPADDLAHRGREDVDAAHDQHVVGAPDAAHARAGAAAAARRASGPRRGRACGSAAAARRDAAGGSARARPTAPSSSATAAPVSGSISSGCTKPRAPRCIPSCALALAPQRDADVADAHRLGHARAPARLERRAERRLAAAGLARHEHALDAGGAQVDAALGRPLDEVGRVGRREHRGLGPQQLDRADEPLGVARADRDVAEADALERRERGARRERPRVVGGDDALARARRPTPRSCAPSRSPSSRGRPRSAGCSWACPSCRWWSRSARSPPARRTGARRSGRPACRSP